MATHSKTHNSVNRKRRLARRTKEADMKKDRLAAAGTPQAPRKPDKSRHG